MGVANARAVLANHHGGGAIMPTRNERQYQRALETIERLRTNAYGKGHGKQPDTNDLGSWTCNECGYFNFGSRRRCRMCPTSRPAAASASAATTSSHANHSSKGGSGGGKGNGLKGGGRKGGGSNGTGDNQGNSKLLAQIKQLEEQNKALKADLAEKGDKGADKVDDDAELIDEDDEDAAVNADLENLAALQRCYDATLVQLGAEDPMAKALRMRLDAARAKQRAGKPILQQVQAAQRKATRFERQLEAARLKLQELEAKKVELDKEIAEQATKVASSTEEVTKSRQELGELLERAKAEKGTAPPTAAAPAADAQAPAATDLRGAAAAWNAAKLAIQRQLDNLPADTSQDVRQAISEQYVAMEAVLNKLPAPPPEMPQPATDANAGASGTKGETDTSDDNEGGGDAAEMLDVDEAVLAKLAEMFTTGGDEAGETDDKTVGDADANVDDGGGNGSRKARKLMDSRVTAARQFLAGKIPLKKPQLKHGGKNK